MHAHAYSFSWFHRFLLASMVVTMAWLQAGCDSSSCGKPGQACCAANGEGNQCFFQASDEAMCIDDSSSDRNNTCCMKSRTPSTVLSSESVSLREQQFTCSDNQQCCDTNATCQKVGHTAENNRTVELGFCCIPSGGQCPGFGSCCSATDECREGICQPRSPAQTNCVQTGCSSPAEVCNSTSGFCEPCGGTGQACCDTSNTETSACNDPNLSCTAGNRCEIAFSPPDEGNIVIPDPTVVGTVGIGGETVNLSHLDRTAGCETNTSANACFKAHRCGWCKESNTCLEGGWSRSSDGSCTRASGQWCYNPIDCIPKDDTQCGEITDCFTCAQAKERGLNCGWCLDDSGGRCVGGGWEGASNPLNQASCGVDMNYSSEDRWRYAVMECGIPLKAGL